MGHVDQTTRDALRSSLVEGVAQNEAVAALTARVDEIFAAAAETRAVLIGQTEATAITGYGSLAAAKQGGFTEKRWLSSQDQVVRDTHKALNGQTVPTAAKFVSPSGATADHPGAFGVKKEDINCRCAMRPIIPGEAKAIADDPGFEDWHARAWATAATAIEKKVRMIFLAQAEVAKAELRSLTGVYGI